MARFVLGDGVLFQRFKFCGILCLLGQASHRAFSILEDPETLPLLRGNLGVGSAPASSPLFCGGLSLYGIVLWLVGDGGHGTCSLTGAGGEHVRRPQATDLRWCRRYLTLRESMKSCNSIDEAEMWGGGLRTFFDSDEEGAGWGLLGSWPVMWHTLLAGSGSFAGSKRALLLGFPLPSWDCTS